MVVNARLEYLRSRAIAGDAVSLSILPNVTTGKVKVKVLVRPAPAGSSALCRSMAEVTLSFLQTFIGTFSVMDRGHRHSDGTHEVSLRIADAGASQASSTAMNDSVTSSAAACGGGHVGLKWGLTGVQVGSRWGPGGAKE